MIKTQSEINKVSTNQGLLSQLENIILPLQEQEDSVKPIVTQDMLVVDDERTRFNNAESVQCSVPLIKIDTNNTRPNDFKFENRRDSDKELANILANVVFKDIDPDMTKSQK